MVQMAEQKQNLLKEQLEKVQKGYGNYAEVLHIGSYTTWAEVGAVERDDLTDLGTPKGPAGNILKAAKSGYTATPANTMSCKLCASHENCSGFSIYPHAQ